MKRLLDLYHNFSFEKKLNLMFWIASFSTLVILSAAYSIVIYYTIPNQSTSLVFKEFVFAMTLFILPCLGLGFFLSRKFAKSILKPYESLMLAVTKVTATKDFTSRALPVHDGEFGLLIDTFNLMLSEVEKAKDHFDDIIESMPNMMLVVNDDYKICEWNHVLQDFVNVDLNKLKDKELFSLLVFLKPYRKDIDTALIRRKSITLERIEYTNYDVQQFFHLDVYPLTHEKTIVLRFENITEKVRMEDMMMQTEKMISVGGLAAGMAQEIDQPVAGVLQNAQNVVRRLDPNLPKNIEQAKLIGLDFDKLLRYLECRQIVEFLQHIISSGQQACRLTHDLMQFTVEDDIEMRFIALPELLDKVVEMAAADFDMKEHYDFRNIKVIRDYEQGLPQVPCLAADIEQVILNLLKNSAQAMDAKAQSDCVIALRLFLKDDMVVIEIMDNGPGIPKDLQARIFEPFFTTKEVGVGTGLGLSVSYFIINSKHRGFMELESSPDQGTKFIIGLPLEVCERGIEKKAS